MKVGVIFVLAFTAVCLNAQDNRKYDPPAVAKVCGKLQHYALVPVEAAINTVEEKVMNLPGVSVRLYSARDNNECCAGMSPVAQTTTGQWGAFHFNAKNLTGGLYWLAVATNGREYKLLVRYDPKIKSDQLCHETFWEVDDAGNYWKAETVTLD